MFARVLLLNGYKDALLYKIPDSLIPEVKLGSLVHVPLQKRTEAAVVTQILESLQPLPPFVIRELNGIGAFPGDDFFHSFVSRVSAFYKLAPSFFYFRIRHFINQKAAEEEVAPEYFVPDELPVAVQDVTLTHEQQSVVDALLPLLAEPTYAPVLMHGVTGAGKTEVYKRLISKNLALGKTTLFLLPEVTLAMQFEQLFKIWRDDLPLVSFHSATKPSEKKLLWQKLIAGQPLVIIGVHLPVVLPIRNLGLIIVDEEHEPGFVEKKHPKISSREIALWRAHHYKIPILLGSATPSLQTIFNAQKHGWRQFSITKRFTGELPTVRKIHLSSDTKKTRPHFWITRELYEAIALRLESREQMIIFINRRGYSFFLQCKACGHVFECSYCSVSLTYHQPGDLRCHYCDYSQQVPHECPGCAANESQFLKKGIGTQQLVEILQQLFPTMIIARADLDSTSKKRTWQATLTEFKAGLIDMLVGTQTITKGYHFPNVTLVGVVWADINVHFPHYSASEVSLQQLIQVAGRAGRAHKKGEVIIQYLQDHEIFNYVDEQSYMTFAKHELAARTEYLYPPHYRLVCIEVRHQDVGVVTAEVQALVKMYRQIIADNKLPVVLLGPSQPPVNKVMNIEMRTILLKAESFTDIHKVLAVATDTFESQIFYAMHA